MVRIMAIITPDVIWATGILGSTNAECVDKVLVELQNKTTTDKNVLLRPLSSFKTFILCSYVDLQSYDRCPREGASRRVEDLLTRPGGAGEPPRRVAQHLSRALYRRSLVDSDLLNSLVMKLMLLYSEQNPEYARFPLREVEKAVIEGRGDFIYRSKSVGAPSYHKESVILRNILLIISVDIVTVAPDIALNEIQVPRFDSKLIKQGVPDPFPSSSPP